MNSSMRMHAGPKTAWQALTSWRCAEIVGNPTPRRRERSENESNDDNQDPQPIPASEATDPRGQPAAS